MFTWPSWLSRLAHPGPLHAHAPFAPITIKIHWQAERYEEMVEYMKKVAVASDTDLSLEVRTEWNPCLAMYPLLNACWPGHFLAWAPSAHVG